MTALTYMAAARPPGIADARVPCPLCGGLRAAHALLHGRVLDAVALNPFLFASGLAWPVVPARWTVIGAALYTIARNIV